MEWQDEGIVLGVRRHGEVDLVVSALTFEQGRHAGLVKAGASRRQVSLWQAGNRLELTWRARMAEQLGRFSGEPLDAFAATWMHDPPRLAALASACAMAEATLPERQACPALYAGLVHLLRRLEDMNWPEHYVRFELILLEVLGFGLQLDRCAVTGKTEDLSHVSPRTGRAVSRGAAEPYRDRLLALPAFLHRTEPGDLHDGNAASEDEFAQGLRLAGYFFWRHVFDPADRAMPIARDRLAGLFATPPKAGKAISDKAAPERAPQA